MSSSTSTGKPTPAIEMGRASYVDATPFWQALGERKLKLQVCPGTGIFQHPPRPVSLQTGSSCIDWAAVSGKGVIFALTTLRVGPESLAGRLPLKIALIELDEGVRLLGNLVGSHLDEARIGSRVVLDVGALSEAGHYPMFGLDDIDDSGIRKSVPE